MWSSLLVYVQPANKQHYLRAGMMVAKGTIIMQNDTIRSFSVSGILFFVIVRGEVLIMP